MKTLYIALTSIILSVAAQFLLRAGMSSVAAKQAMNQLVGLAKAQAILLNPFVLGGFLLYGIGALVWLEVLSHWDVSKAYPLVGLGFGLSLVIGIALGEHVTTLRTIGVALICIGVFLVGRS